MGCFVACVAFGGGDGYMCPSCTVCGTTCVGDEFCGGNLETGGTNTGETCVLSGACPTLGSCCDKHICSASAGGCVFNQGLTQPGNTDGNPSDNGNINLGDGTIIKPDGTTVLPCGTVLAPCGTTCADGCPCTDCCPCTGQKSSGVGGGSGGGSGSSGGGSAGAQKGSLPTPKMKRSSTGSGNQRTTLNTQGVTPAPSVTAGKGIQSPFLQSGLENMSPQMFTLVIIVLSVFLIALAFGGDRRVEV